MNPAVSVNINIGILQGTIMSEFRDYVNQETKKNGIEFELMVTSYIKPKKGIMITCLSEGVQSELIKKSKKPGEGLLVMGYMAEGDVGGSPPRSGHNKFRITSIHFQNFDFMIFSGRILTQPIINPQTKECEFTVGTYRYHKSVPLQPCKMKVICSGDLAVIMKEFEKQKTVGDYIQILGSLDEINGAHVIRAKRIELLLSNSTKEPVFQKIKGAVNAKGDDKGNTDNSKKDYSKGNNNANESDAGSKENVLSAPAVV
jgi:hypothetical protein